MESPVVLIGTKVDGSGLGAVGLYADKDAAYQAVMSGDLPNDCHYSVMTPKMDTTMVPRVIEPR